MTGWTREEIVAVARAEIEREGIHVEISDDDLWEAIVSPLREHHRRYLVARSNLDASVRRAEAAIASLAEAFRRGEDFDRMRAEIDALPTTDDGPRRGTPPAGDQPRQGNLGGRP